MGRHSGHFLRSQQSRGCCFREGTPVQIGSRAFDILLVLISRPGEVVSKREIMDRAWAGLTVDEGSLRVQLAALRKALGECAPYGRNVPGRGYCFAGSLAYERKPVKGPASVPHAAFALEEAECCIGTRRFFSNDSRIPPGHRSAGAGDGRDAAFPQHWARPVRGPV